MRAAAITRAAITVGKRTSWSRLGVRFPPVLAGVGLDPGLLRLGRAVNGNQVAPRIRAAAITRAAITVGKRTSWSRLGVRFPPVIAEVVAGGERKDRTGEG
jgi:hypothetical protein